MDKRRRLRVIIRGRLLPVLAGAVRFLLLSSWFLCSSDLKG